jgi:hypothetical protein
MAKLGRHYGKDAANARLGHRQERDTYSIFRNLVKLYLRFLAADAIASAGRRC